jgi:DNA polymerase-3 subunit gamma/tau
MSYLVLARKWRPVRFEDVAGQEHITRILANAIRTNRIAHAYLFSGIRGVGKTTAARILAKALNCIRGPTPEPCNQCDQCLEISSGSSIDVYEIDGASNRGIDEVREIIENVRYQPAKSRFKIYIIDEVHQVTKEAFNALLKTLEEPPPFAKFILATTEPQRLPETILSRCQRLDFRRISVREIVQRLKHISQTENLRITDGALLLIAREADGSMRDAQSLLEQVLSYASPAGEETRVDAEIDERRLEEILGMAERKILYDIAGAVIQEKAGECVELVAKIATQGLDIPRLSRDLVEHFRNLLVMSLILEREKGEKEGDQPLFSNYLLDVPEEEIEDLKLQASALSKDTIMDYYTLMAAADESLTRSAYPRFALETALVRLATLPKTLPVSALLERLERLEGKLGPPAGPAKNHSAERKANPSLEQPTPTNSEFPTAAGEDKAEVWSKFVAFVIKEKRFLGAYLEKVQPLELSSKQIKIGAGDRFNLDSLRDAENINFLKDLARRFFSTEVTVTIAPWEPVDGGSKKSATPGKSPDPLSVMADATLRELGGTIREVKKNI